ncbi:MAG TPA: hypothetical protein DCE65_03425 [Clostridiales bacterium]|nr:hypothetical protein [Clostridiales bacterium]
MFFIFLRDFICRKHCIIFYWKNQPRTSEKTIIRAGKIFFDIVVSAIFGAIYTGFFKKTIFHLKNFPICATLFLWKFTR